MAKGLPLLLLLLASCAPPPDPQALSSYPPFDPSVPVAGRVADMPGWLVSMLETYDGVSGYRSYRPDLAERGAFAAALEDLPPRMRKVLDERLIAVYFVSGLRGNGVTNWATDAEKRVYVTMILNPAAFRMSLSETLTRRERSAFKGRVEVSVDAGEGGTGILYSLAHEAAHAFDYVAGLTPSVSPHFGEAMGRSSGRPWDAWLSYVEPKPAHNFLTRGRLFFYGHEPPLLAPDEAAEAYRQLSGSPFASLYGSRNWADDAADLFFFHHLTTKLKRPYRVRLGGKTVLEPMSRPGLRERAKRVLAPIYAS